MTSPRKDLGSRLDVLTVRLHRGFVGAAVGLLAGGLGALAGGAVTCNYFAFWEYGPGCFVYGGGVGLLVGVVAMVVAEVRPITAAVLWATPSGFVVGLFLGALLNTAGC